MAWDFTLSAECGQAEAAENFVRHFMGEVWVLTDGLRSEALIRTFRDSEQHWWGVVRPSEISRSGVTNETNARQMTELGFLLYERLRTAPSYRYALVGVEVDEFRCFSELDEDVATLAFDGLVLHDDVWKKLGSAEVFVPFTFGNRWRPYRGERMKPRTIKTGDIRPGA
jgi:hypothetical protein